MMDRRRFLQGATPLLLGGCVAWGLPSTLRARGARPLAKAEGIAGTLGTARNLIFIALDGGPSHVDTFDLKRGYWTPDSLGAETLANGVDWPSGLMPKLAQRIDRFSLLRSLTAQEAVHSRALYHLLTAHRQNPALTDEIPNFVSVLSYKLEAERREGDALPTALALGFEPIGAGFLPARHKAFQLNGDGQIPHFEHVAQPAARRFQLLDRQRAAYAKRDAMHADYLEFQDGARRLMADAELNGLFNQTDPDQGDGQGRGAQFLRACQTAVKALAADKGARVALLSLPGWDHHLNIHDAGNLPALAGAFDEGFSYLLDALEAEPAIDGPGTLLDETLIVAVGEFGRTVGRLNSGGGRDHYPYALPAVLAGGGVTPGLAHGATDGTGAYVADPGWSRNRYMLPNDLLATIYSAMGVDWTERFEDTPSGRVYEIVDSSQSGVAYPIGELFA